MNRKILIYSLGVVFVFIFSGRAAAQDASGMHMDHARHVKPIADEKGGIAYYTCGMHPSVRVSVENYEKGETQCPICFMPLTLVEKIVSGNDEKFDENVISRVDIKMGELKLAGVKMETVTRQHLFKTIRAVGKVAYDPQLAIAQDEFISSVKSYEKAKEGSIEGIAQRAESLIESSRRKLLLLGLNESQIKELEEKKQVQSNLILPSDKMWIYGDIYEYELSWIKEGAMIKARPISLVGQEFFGAIVSINPVVDPLTRSVRFRALIDNPSQKLKPQMYVDVEIMSQYSDPDGKTEVLSIPKSALLDTGRRRIVWVDKGGGQFEGRSVEIGPESVGHSDQRVKFYPVLKGLREGERVVTKGNFLIDSQSQITGVAASSYGGALEPVESKGPIGHQH